MQTFYSLIAIALVGLLALSLHRGTKGLQQRMIVNEVATQLSGVAVETLERIGQEPFDAKTDTTKVSKFPAVTDPSQLTNAADFGGCFDFELCEDIDDFDGLIIVRDYETLRFTVTIGVRYVLEDQPDIPSAGPTYAKEVSVSVANPRMWFFDPSNKLTVTMSRVFTYQKATKA